MNWPERILLFGKLMKEVGFPVLAALYLIGILTGAFPSFITKGLADQSAQIEGHRSASERIMGELAESARRQNRLIGLLCTAAVEPVLKAECVR